MVLLIGDFGSDVVRAAIGDEVTDFDEWVKLDLQYIDNWSLKLDCVILARTIPAVLKGVGAV